MLGKTITTGKLLYRNNSKSLKMLQWYIPFVPRPKVNINDTFMNRLTVNKNDSELKQKTKQEMYDFFRPYYGTQQYDLTNDHFLSGSLVRCFVIIGSVSNGLGITFLDPELPIIIILTYIGMVVILRAAAIEDMKPMSSNLDKYHNLFKDEE